MAVAQLIDFRGAATLTMPMVAFLKSSGMPQSGSQAPTPGRSERQTALFRVFVFEADDGDVKCVKTYERSLLSRMVRAYDVSSPTFASFSVRALPACSATDPVMKWEATLVKSRSIVRVPDAKHNTEVAYTLKSELNTAH